MLEIWNSMSSLEKWNTGRRGYIFTKPVQAVVSDMELPVPQQEPESSSSCPAIAEKSEISPLTSIRNGL